MSRAGRRFRLWWLGPIFMLASLIGFGLGWLGMHENAKYEHAVTTTGTSVAQEYTMTRSGTGQDRRLEHCWKPVIEFQEIETGTSHRFTSSICDQSRWANPVGTTYEVEYVPDSDPMLAREKSVLSTWMLPVIGFGVGAVFLLFGAVFVVVGRRIDASIFTGRDETPEHARVREEVQRRLREQTAHWDQRRGDGQGGDEHRGHVGSDTNPFGRS